MTIWKTPEADAWSRGFGYDDYVIYHAKTGVTSKPVSELTYDMLKDAFWNQMYEDQYEQNPSNS